MTAKEILECSPIIPVISINDISDALPLAKALYDGGIGIMEVTLRTDLGLDAIKIIREELPQMCVGAGTVMTEEAMKSAVQYGAQFVFSPGISQELITTAKALETIFVPGVATPTDIIMAINSDIEYCKLFPASVVGGIAALNAYSGPFPEMKFCPTGGINLENVNDFLACENVVCVGGTWMVPKNVMKEKNFPYVTRLCEETLKHIK